MACQNCSGIFRLAKSVGSHAIRNGGGSEGVVLLEG